MANLEKKINRGKIQSSYISVIISMSLVLFMIGLIGVMLIGANQIAAYVKSNYFKYEVIFQENSQEAEINTFIQKVQQQKFVQNIAYTNREKALDEARKQMGLTPDDLNYDALIFPPSATITLQPDFVETQKMDSISQLFQQEKVIESVDYERTNLKNIFANIRKFQWIVVAVAAIFLTIALLLINNAIRLNLFAKRFTIKTMQLIGAKRAFIQKPFLLKALFMGFISALGAILGIAALLYYAMTYGEIKVIEKLDIQYLLLEAILLIAIGVIISFVSTYIATSKYLKLQTDQLYY